MTLSHSQLEIRKSVVGASEAAAVLGLSPFQSAADVYWNKVADVEPSKPTEAQARGCHLEPAILAWAGQVLGVELLTNRPTVIHPTLPMGVTPDADIVGRSCEAVEAKSTIEQYADEWGDEGTDQIPDGYLVQCHAHMAVRPAIARVYVPVWILTRFGPQGRMYVVNRDDQVSSTIAEKVTAFWREHVERRVPPPDAGTPPLDFLKRLRRQPASTVHLGQQAVEAVEKWETAKLAAKVAEEMKDAAQAKVLELLGVETPAECGVLPDGRQITYMQQKSAPGLNKELLKTKWPEAFEACVTQGMHRTLRLKKSK